MPSHFASRCVSPVSNAPPRRLIGSPFWRVAALVVMIATTSGVREAVGGAIPSLFNTGFGVDGRELSDSAVDPHYTLVSVPTNSGAGFLSFVTRSDRFPLSTQPGGWLLDDATSKWISPTADQSTYVGITSPALGYYVYRTYFNLSSFVPRTAQISGRWSTDNFGLDILLNGTSTGFTHDDPNVQFHAFSGFSINSGFVDGVNTLDFVVSNPGDPGIINPTGLRVEMTGSADLPLPGDANRDGTVNFTDLLTLAQHYGKAGTHDQGDFNADGSVGFDDLLLLAQNYGRSLPDIAQSRAVTSPLPDPTGIGMFLTLILLRRGRS